MVREPPDDEATASGSGESPSAGVSVDSTPAKPPRDARDGTPAVDGKVPPEADSGSPPLAILEKFPGIPATRMKPLVACQQAVGYAFRNPKLLLSALTHASSADHRVVSNERMEFLGDAVLALVICQDLYERFPTLLEGELTKIKSVVVSRRTCARVSKTLGLERFLILGRGMAAQDGVPTSVLAAVFESIIAAIYQDSGLGPAREFILRTARSEIEKAAGGHHGGNYKSILQQLAQKEFGQIPTYEVLAEDGPDHSKSFKVAAVIAAQRYVPAWGANKKEAQQRAALNALSQIRGLEVPFPAA